MRPSTFHSRVFDTETMPVPGGGETIVRGGRQVFDRLGRAFAGIERIGVIGWGPQGRAQARNLRDSLAGTGITVEIGLRRESASVAEARADGFDVDSPTAVAGRSDLVLLLIADAALVDHHEQLFGALRPGAVIGLSHGFLLGHLESTGGAFPDGHAVVAVCPKGMGDSVRRLYRQGSGINASVAVHADPDGRASDIALGWSIALGAPYTFTTTLRAEYLSDVVGERAILLGAVHGLVESLYRHFRITGDDPVTAYERSCENVTGPIASAISRGGLTAVRDGCADPSAFDRAYAAAYGPARELVVEIYDEVVAGTELRSVLLAARRLQDRPMSRIGGSEMWEHAAAVRARRSSGTPLIDPLTAGFFVATMTAQVDEFAARGHAWSEIVNESVIEAVDSLLPYMHARDVAYMVDNCSRTARLGTRRWGPRFQAAYEQVALPAVDDEPDPAALKAFIANPVHEVLATASTFRPPVDIAL